MCRGFTASWTISTSVVESPQNGGTRVKQTPEKAARFTRPDADYHVRTLLRRAIRQDASTTVVLAERDGPDGGHEDAPMSATAQRYVDFFGKERVAFDFSGVRGYFRPLIGAQKLGARLGTFRQMLDRRVLKD